MERTVRYRVRGLEGADKAQRVSDELSGRDGLHEVQADPMSGQVWMRYESDAVSREELETYLREAGVEPTGEEPGI